MSHSPDGEGAETISEPTQRKYLNALSRLFRRARARKLVPATHNPIADLDEKPDWLEHDEAALLLYAASRYQPKRRDSLRYAVVLIGTLLLTGARSRPGQILSLTARQKRSFQGIINQALPISARPRTLSLRCGRR